MTYQTAEILHCPGERNGTPCRKNWGIQVGRYKRIQVVETDLPPRDHEDLMHCPRCKGAYRLVHELVAVA